MVSQDPSQNVQTSPSHSSHHDGDASSELKFNTTPNWLTLARIALVPVLVYLMMLRTPTGNWAAMVVFVIASVTDFFDGYIARLQKSVSIYGKLMDPLADKFLEVSALIILLHQDRIHPIVVILLICRELGVTGLRALASAEGVVIAASDGGKWKTATQMTALPMLILARPLFGLPIEQIGHVLLYISLFMSLWSGKSYVIGFFKGLAERRKARRAIKRSQKQENRAKRRSRGPS